VLKSLKLLPEDYLLTLHPPKGTIFAFRELLILLSYLGLVLSLLKQLSELYFGIGQLGLND
jgi:hypothetical protein